MATATHDESAYKIGFNSFKLCQTEVINTSLGEKILEFITLNLPKLFPNDYQPSVDDDYVENYGGQSPYLQFNSDWDSEDDEEITYRASNRFFNRVFCYIIRKIYICSIFFQN